MYFDFPLKLPNTDSYSEDHEPYLWHPGNLLSPPTNTIQQLLNHHHNAEGKCFCTVTKHL